MRSTPILLLCSAFLVATVSYSPAAAQSPLENALRKYTLQVESVSAVKPAHIRGALWVDGSQRRVEVLDQDTPFQTTTFGDVVSAILQADSGASIRVSLMDAQTGQPHLQGVGNSIVIADGLAFNPGWSFVR